MQTTLYINYKFQNEGAIYSQKLDIASDLDFLTNLLKLDNDNDRMDIVIKMINSLGNKCFAVFCSLTSEPMEEGWDNLGDDARYNNLTLLDAFIADPAEHIGDWNELIERQAAKDKTADENHMTWEKASISTDAIALIRNIVNGPYMCATYQQGKGVIYKLDAACDISISPIQAWDYTVKFKTYFELNSKRKHLSITTLLNLLEAWAIHEDFQWLVKKEGEKLEQHNLTIEAVYGLTDKLLHIRIGRRDRYGFEFASVTDVFTPMGVNVDIIAATPTGRDEDEAIENAVKSLIRHCSINKNRPWLVDALALANKEAKEKGLYK
nr:MAG TPA: hypothetical protein [Caudoviricetes sp.]